MGKVIVVENLTLDGVMQAPARPDEDTRDGFRYGGWALPYNGPVARYMGQHMGAHAGALLFGRRTYEDFAAVWPGRTDNPFTEVLDKTRKYVASRTLTEPLPWRNSTLLKGEATAAVAELKQRHPDEHLTILGSGELVRSLMPHGLIDEYLLVIHPLVLGAGRRLFGDACLALRLDGSVTTANGVVIATYRPEAPPSDRTS